MNGVGRKKSNFSTSLFDFGFDYVAKAIVIEEVQECMYNAMLRVLLKFYHTVC